MRLGLHIPDFTWAGGPPALGQRLAEIARTAELAGFDRVSVMDHVWQIDHIGAPEQEMLESYTTLGYLAACTERVKLLAVVSAVVYREPGLLAKAVSTLDVVSSGRAMLGIGAARRGTRTRPGASACCSRRPVSGSSAWRRHSRSACRCGATTTVRTKAGTTSWLAH